MGSNLSPPLIRLNIGGKKFCTTIDTLTQREPNSMLAAMFSGRHSLSQDSDKGYVFIDRDGKHFRHILNWLRDGDVPALSDLECLQLKREAEYYQLLGLLDAINAVVDKRKENGDLNSDLTRNDIIKYVQLKKLCSLRGLNLSGLNLSKLNLPNVDFSYASLVNANLQGACLTRSRFEGADLRNANLQHAILFDASLKGANLEGTNLEGAMGVW